MIRIDILLDGNWHEEALKNDYTRQILSVFTVFCNRHCIHVWSVAQLRLTLQPHGLEPARLLCPWSFPGKNTGVGCRFLL